MLWIIDKCWKVSACHVKTKTYINLFVGSGVTSDLICCVIAIIKKSNSNRTISDVIIKHINLIVPDLKLL
jgi:hypothetical protein